MKFITWMVVLAAFLAGAFVYKFLDTARLPDTGKPSPATIAKHWRIVERHRALIMNPANYKPTQESPGLSSVTIMQDPMPSLAALVSAGELEHVDLVFPTVMNKRAAARLWMPWPEHNKDILNVTGNPTYTDYKITGEQPLHLNIWFRPRAKQDVQQLIVDLEKLAPAGK